MSRKKILRASGGVVVTGGYTAMNSPKIILIPQGPIKIPHSLLQAGSCDRKCIATSGRHIVSRSAVLLLT